MDRANDIFDQIDTDKSGGLDKGEITIHLLALGQEQETVMEMFALLDADNDGFISREEFVNGFQKYQEFCKLSAKRMAQGLDLDLRLDVVHGLEPHNFTDLYHEKIGAHLTGTREWAFKEVFAWLDAAPSDAAQLFWLMGGGGVGKSVLTAELLHRTYRSNRVVAWHFCRHDNPQQSSPDALLRSLAAMLCARLPGYKEALGEVASELLKATDPKELFAALFTSPLQKVKSPAKPSFIILDALDELPKQWQKPLLSVIAAQLSTLPQWLRLFVTSREEPQIKAALAKFEPKELRADEANNRADVEVYLRSIARMHVQGEVNAADIEKDVKRRFGIDLAGKLAELQEPMDKSRVIYGKAVAALEGTDGYNEVLAIRDDRPEVRQASDDFDVVYAQAEAARDLLRNALSDEWFVDEERKRLGKTDFYYPVPAQKRAWVDQAIDPGVKGDERAKEKMKNDYGGHANLLKDLARITLKYESCDRMATAIKELKKAGFSLVVSKNKYLSPTPMGYCDLNFIVELKLKDGTPYLAEVQVNHVAMLEAKSEAHTHYEVVRKRLPELCTGSMVDPGELEAFIVDRLNSSALDTAVAALSAKADGLFLYAHLLAQHLDTEAKAGRSINFAGLDALPTGLDEVYAVNFHRAFPKGADDAAWTAARPLIELIAAAMEPITQAMAAALLGWDAAQQERVLEATALLFPVRDGKFYVFHKTVVDWLTGEIDAQSSVKTRSKTFRVERFPGHNRLADGFERYLNSKRLADDALAVASGLPLGEETLYWLRHGLVHVCRAKRAASAAGTFCGQAALDVLRVRAAHGWLQLVSRDYQELQLCWADLGEKEQQEVRWMARFVGRFFEVLRSDGARAVTQLASMQPDQHPACAALLAEGTKPVLRWVNKKQQLDPISFQIKGSLCAFDRAPSGRLALVDGLRGTLSVWSTESLAPLAELEDELLLHTSPSKMSNAMVAWSPDERYVAAWVGAHILVAGVSLEDESLVIVIKAERHRSSKPYFMWTSNASHLVWAVKDGDGARGQSLDIASGHLADEYSAAIFSRAVSAPHRIGGGDEILRSGGDLCLISSSWCEGHLIGLTADAPPPVTISTKGHTSPGGGSKWESIAFSPDGRSLAIAQRGMVVLLWVADGIIYWGTGDANDTITRWCDFTSACFSDDGKLLLTSDETRNIDVWDLEDYEPLADELKKEARSGMLNGKSLLRLEGQHGSTALQMAAPCQVSGGAFTGKLISASPEELLEWDVAIAQAGGQVVRHRNLVSHIAWDGAGRWFATQSVEGELLIWSARTGVKLLDKNVFGSALDSRGSMLLVGVTLFAVVFEDVRGIESVTLQPCDTGIKTCQVFSGTTAIARFGADEKTLFVWDDGGKVTPYFGVVRAFRSADGKTFTEDEEASALLYKHGSAALATGLSDWTRCRDDNGTLGGTRESQQKHLDEREQWLGPPLVNSKLNVAYVVRRADRAMFTIDLATLNIISTGAEPSQIPLACCGMSGAVLCGYTAAILDSFSILSPSSEGAQKLGVTPANGKIDWHTPPAGLCFGCCSFSCAGTGIVALGCYGRVILFDVTTKKVVGFFPTKGNTTCASFAPHDAATLVAADESGEVYLLRANNATQ